MRTKRDDIVDAAAMLFAQKGVHGASVPQILQLANASAGAMYSYFESKRELHKEVFRLAYVELNKKVWQGFPYQATTQEQLRSLLRRYHHFITSHEHYAALIFLTHSADAQPKHKDPLHQLLGLWQQDPAAPATPSVQGMYTIMTGVLIQLVHQHYVDKQELQLSLIDELTAASGLMLGL